MQFRLSFFLQPLLTGFLVIMMSGQASPQVTPDSIPADTVQAGMKAGQGKGGGTDVTPENQTPENNNGTPADTLTKKEKKTEKKPDKAKAAVSDTSKKHSPKTAAIMSAVLPGLGQVYNRKYWKLPIIYGGFGVLGYLGYDYFNRFSKYKETYMFRQGLKPDGQDYYPDRSDEFVLEYKNYYRRNFELTCVIGGALYLLNIIDATVDAHLFTFDVSEDLSFRLQPSVTTFGLTGAPAPSVRLSLKF